METVAEFRAWARERIAELTTNIDDTRGPLTTEQAAHAAELIRQAKVFAYQLNLPGLCDRLPAREYKCAVDAIRRLEECVAWNEPAPTVQEGQAMTVVQAAEVLGISERTVRELVARDELGHFRAGNGRGQIRILPRHIQSYQERSEATGFRHLFR